MPRYTFYRLTDDVHNKWRGPLQLRVRFKKRTVCRLDDDDLQEIIIDRIKNDRTGKNKPGKWMVIEHETNNRFMFKIEGGF